MKGLIEDDKEDEIGSVGKIWNDWKINRKIEERIEKEDLKKKDGDIIFKGIVWVIMVEDKSGFYLKELVLIRKEIGIVKVRSKEKSWKNRRIWKRMKGLNEGNIGKKGLIMRCKRIVNKIKRKKRIMDSIEKSKKGKKKDSKLILMRFKSLKRLDVVGKRKFLRKKEIECEKVKELKIIIIIDEVKVDGEKGRGNEFGRGFILNINENLIGKREKEKKNWKWVN